jgi:hypothetical protein
MADEVKRTDAELRRDIERAKYLYNPDDPSVRHPHPHGMRDYDDAGNKGLKDFVKKNQDEEKNRKEERTTSKKHSEDNAPLVSRTSSTTTSSTGRSSGSSSKPAPSVPSNLGGGSGSITFLDCDGNNIASIIWKDGIITSSGDKSVSTGCGPYG